MKYFFACAILVFMSCNGQPPQGGGSKNPPDTTVQIQPPPVPPAPPTPPAYTDEITVVSMSNSVNTAKVNDVLVITLQVKNTGNDECNMCNAQINYRQNDFTGSTVFASSVDNVSPTNNLMPGQTGSIVAKFPVTTTGNYTFDIHDLFGVFNGTHSTRHFSGLDNITTTLSVLQ